MFEPDKIPDYPQFTDAAGLIIKACEEAFGLLRKNDGDKAYRAIMNTLKYYCEPREVQP